MKQSAFGNDPFATLAEAFKQVFPKARYIAQIENEVLGDDGEDLTSYTAFPRGENAEQVAVVGLSAKMVYDDMVDVFARELARVAAGREHYSEQETVERNYYALRGAFAAIIQREKAEKDGEASAVQKLQ